MPQLRLPTRSPVTRSASGQVMATMCRPSICSARSTFTLSASLKRALDRKTQAGYESVDISAADAASCVKWTQQLLEAAAARLEG